MEQLNDIHRRYGLKQLQLEEAIEAQMTAIGAFNKTLDLLRRLKSGETKIEDVEITEAGWSA